MSADIRRTESDSNERHLMADLTGDKLGKTKGENGQEGASEALGYKRPDPQFAHCIRELIKLGDVLADRFHKLGRLEDARNATRCKWFVIHLAPNTGPLKPLLLAALGDFYVNRFVRFGELEAVNQAIRCQYQALQLPLDDDHELKSSSLGGLGNAYLHRYDCRGNVADVDRAINCMINAVELTPDGDAGKPRRQFRLGVAYIRRFQRHGDVTDADKSIQCYMQAVKTVPDHYPEKPGWLSNLGNAYSHRFRDRGDLVDADQSIKYHMQSVQLSSDDDDEKPLRINNLAAAYIGRYLYNRHGDVEDLSQAIQMLVGVVQFFPDSHFRKPGVLCNLGQAYIRRFERHGNVEDINRAIDSYKEATRLIPEERTEKPSELCHLALAYEYRFGRHGNVADIDMAIDSYVKAMRLTPDGQADKPDKLSRLGNAYMLRFERNGYIADIDESINCHAQAIRFTPDDHTGKPTMLCRLGNSYLHRFQRHRDIADIDRAIKCQLEALQLTPASNAIGFEELNNLGLSFMRRFEHRGDVADADRSIIYLTHAVQLVPRGDDRRPVILSNVGAAYMCRIELRGYGEIADIIQAIKYRVEAVEITPDDHADKPRALNNLGNTYRCRFECQGDPKDVDKAITYQMQAVELTPDGHAEKPTFFDGLGNSYLRRFKHSSQSLDLQAATTSFEKAAQSNTGDLRIRFAASSKWAHYSLLLGVSPRLAYCRTMKLVLQLVGIGTTIQRRYDLLLEVGNFSVEAASWAIRAKDYDCALEWLEQGRSIVWNQILQLRTPFDDLYAVNPELAKELKGIAQKLEQAGSRTEASEPANNALGPEKQAQYHRRLAAKWDQLLVQTREIPGFEEFMQPRTAAQLMRAAKDGPLIVVNVHQDRSDALIVQPNNDSIAHVPLDTFSQSRAVDLHVQLMSWIGHRGSRNRGFQRKKPVDDRDCHPLKLTLATLWFEVVKPIFDFLGYTRKLSIEELPHVTWCTTGALSFFPLHAAGCYDGTQLNALDLAISSYTPTISALLAPNRQTPIPSSGILAVGQQFTKGHCSLPYTVQELAVIKEQAGKVGYLQLDGNNATVAAVLSAMEEYGWVHLACHASQHKENPAQSAFHLHDGALMLSMITQRSFKNKGLAFLSACQTATGDEKLPDEAVHLAAGMLMAGYPSVIATMWSIHDEDAPEVSRQVYADLLKDGRMDFTNVARALHKAVEGLRETVGVSSFERWLPFIHIGL